MCTRESVHWPIQNDLMGEQSTRIRFIYLPIKHQKKLSEWRHQPVDYVQHSVLLSHCRCFPFIVASIQWKQVKPLQNTKQNFITSILRTHIISYHFIFLTAVTTSKHMRVVDAYVRKLNRLIEGWSWRKLGLEFRSTCAVDACSNWREMTVSLHFHFHCSIRSHWQK